MRYQKIGEDIKRLSDASYWHGN